VTTKKLVIVICSVLAAGIVLVVLFVGAIVGITFYSISNSEAATTAKAFLKSNEILKADIGEVRDFGTFITGNVNTQNADGTATLYLKVIGEKRTVQARVDLMYKENRAWRVTGASYQNEAGKTVDLLEQYESAPTEP
jgi:flagellar basal body-associated protein FliL